MPSRVAYYGTAVAKRQIQIPKKVTSIGTQWVGRVHLKKKPIGYSMNEFSDYYTYIAALEVDVYLYSHIFFKK